MGQTPWQLKGVPIGTQVQGCPLAAAPCGLAPHPPSDILNELQLAPLIVFAEEIAA